MAYTSTAAADRLAQVREMMQKVLGGAQEYYVGTRRTRYPTLRELQDLEQSLMQQVAAEENGVLSVGIRVPAA